MTRRAEEGECAADEGRGGGKGGGSRWGVGSRVAGSMKVDAAGSSDGWDEVEDGEDGEAAT